VTETSTSLVPIVEQAKYRGVPVYFDGKEWIVPPLSVRQFRDNLALLTEPVGEVNPANAIDRMNKFVPVVGLALRRNYPEVTDEYLLDALDLRTFFEVLVAVQKASGLKVATPGEAAPVAAK
jgi:hypothetical protein